MKEKNIIRLMRGIREEYAEEQRFHYFTFCAFVLILLLDFIIIIYTRVITMNAYAWSGIIFLFTLLAVEGIQYNKYKGKKESVDTFYLSGELRK